MLRLLLSVLMCGVLGTGLVFLLWPSKKLSRFDFWIKSSLSVGVGLGISSCTLFVWLAVFGPSSMGFILTESLLAISIATLLWYRFTRYSPASSLTSPCLIQPKIESKLEISRFVSLLFYAGLILTTLISIRLIFRQPHGQYDGLAIWNMRARFIFRGGAGWTDAFTKILSSWSHPDYPLLLPLSVVRGWYYVGSDTTIVPGLIAIAFALATVVLMFSSVAVLRGKTQGYLAGLVLLWPALYIRMAVSEYADIPLGFFILATIVLLYLHDRTQKSSLLILAGLTAGLAAWTKNEGLLFLASVITARIAFSALFPGQRRLWISRLAYFSMGLMPVLLTLVCFKFRFAPANDLLSSQEFHLTASKLRDFSRYATILKAFKDQILGFDGWHTNPLYFLVIYTFCLGVRIETRDRIVTATAITTICLVALGYFFIYVTTPHDLMWHLRSSLARLLLQLWPAVVFIYFTLVRTPEQVLTEKELTPLPSATT
jgi:dolichyl-phosphate-mannose-protein mannosyltransferase